jgi:OOP family OmpA-OmpF porin
MTIRNILLAGFVGLGVLASSASFAAGPWYGGVGAGWTRTNAGASDIHLNLQSEHAPTSTTVDDTDKGWKLFVGYQYNPRLAFELSYTALGDFTLNADITSPGSGTLSDKVSPKAWCLSALGSTLPQNNFSFTGRAGICHWDDNFGGTHTIAMVETPEEPNSTGTGLLLGFGVNYDLGNNMSVRAEWERYFDVIHDKKDADLLSIGLAVRF